MPPLACMDTVHFMQRFAKMTPNDFLKNKELQMFCIIAYRRSIKTWKNTWSLERSWNLLQNLSNRYFLAQFVEKLQWNQHNICKYDPFNWRSLTPTHLLNIYSSMPRRIAAVIAYEGGTMKYQCIEIILLEKLCLTIRLNQRNLWFTMAHFICAEWYRSSSLSGLLPKKLKKKMEKLLGDASLTTSSCFFVRTIL